MTRSKVTYNSLVLTNPGSSSKTHNSHGSTVDVISKYKKKIFEMIKIKTFPPALTSIAI